MNKTEKYIILNKPFIGEYLSGDNHNAHEIINFFKADNGMHFLYNNPYGQFIAKQKNIEPDVDYVVFTSKTKDKCFYIKYVAKVECVLHKQCISKKYITNNEYTDKYYKNGLNEIEETLRSKYNLNSIDEIRYDGTPISKLFSDDSKELPITFVCENLYKPKTPIKIDGSDDLFDYNFQRNFGYVSEETKNPNAYAEINKYLMNINKYFDVVKVEKFKALNIDANKESLDSLDPYTFLDLISMHKEEESYTKMLDNLINCDNRLLNSLLDIILYKKKPANYSKDSSINQISNIKGEFSFNNKYLCSEYNIDKVGRIDLYTEADNCRLIIENKIESGINYNTINNQTIDQLNRYYKYFTDLKKKDNKSNIFVILVPEYNHEDIITEINDLPNNMDKHWFILGYSDIYNLIKNNKTIIEETIYGKYYSDLLLLTKRQSFNVNELAHLKLTKNKTKL